MNPGDSLSVDPTISRPAGDLNLDEPRFAEKSLDQSFEGRRRQLLGQDPVQHDTPRLFARLSLAERFTIPLLGSSVNPVILPRGPSI